MKQSDQTIYVAEQGHETWNSNFQKQIPSF